MHSRHFLLFWQDCLRTSASSAVEWTINCAGRGGTQRLWLRPRGCAKRLSFEKAVTVSIAMESIVLTLRNYRSRFAFDVPSTCSTLGNSAAPLLSSVNDRNDVPERLTAALGEREGPGVQPALSGHVDTPRLRFGSPEHPARRESRQACHNRLVRWCAGHHIKGVRLEIAAGCLKQPGRRGPAVSSA
jgi:hypothetical protein